MTVKQKVKNHSGFTLAETMLAVLIMLLVAAIMSSGVPVAKKAYEKVVLSANAQSLFSTAVSTLRDELGTAWDVTTGDETIEGVLRHYIEYYSADTGARTRLYIDKPSGKTEFEIYRQEYVRQEGLNAGEGSSFQTGTPLIPAKTSTDNLKLTCTDLTYEDGIVTVTGLKVSTTDGLILASMEKDATNKEKPISIRVFSKP